MPLDPDSVELLDTAGNPVDEVAIDDVGTYTPGPGGVIVFTPVPSFTGTAPAVPYRIADANGTTARSTYTPTVTPAPGVPTALPDTTTGPQGAPQTIDPLANDTAGEPDAPLDPATVTLVGPDGNPTDTVDVTDVGTYRIERPDGAVRIVFTPQPSFTGTAPAVGYRVADSAGAIAQSTYTPVVTPITPAAVPDASTGPQGAVQQVDVSLNDTPGSPDVPLDPASVALLDDDGQPVVEQDIQDVGTYTRGDGGVIVFTPVPEFTGTAPAARYRIADANETAAESTYTPTVTPIPRPVAAPDASSGLPGQPQSIDPLSNDSPAAASVPLDPESVVLLDASGNPTPSLDVAGVGRYSVERSDGGVRIQFLPEPTFSGTAPGVRYRVADINGATTESTYTVSVSGGAATPPSSPPSGPAVDPASPPRGGLATTGGTPIPVGAGIILLLGGLVLVVRRRRVRIGVTEGEGRSWPLV